MYCGSGAGRCCCMCRADALCTHQMEALFEMTVMATISKVGCQIENLTLSNDAYLLEEQSCQTSSWSHLKQLSVTRFWRCFPNKKKKNNNNNSNNNNKISSDMWLVPGPKSNYSFKRVRKNIDYIAFFLEACFIKIMLVKWRMSIALRSGLSDVHPGCLHQSH